MNNKNIIQFNISKETDLEILKILLKDKNPSDERLNLIFKKFPYLTDIHKNNKVELFNDLIDSEYKKEMRRIKSNKLKIEKQWETIEPIFLNLTKKHFSKININNYHITATPSIWPLFIKDIKKMLITFPYDKNTKEAIKNLKLKAEVEKVTDIEKIMSYGIMSTPALVIDEKVVSYGKVLSSEEIKGLLE